MFPFAARVTLAKIRSNLKQSFALWFSSSIKKDFLLEVFQKLGWKDSNLRNGWTKTSCLTTWRHPIRHSSILCLTFYFVKIFFCCRVLFYPFFHTCNNTSFLTHSFTFPTYLNSLPSLSNMYPSTSLPCPQQAECIISQSFNP